MVSEAAGTESGRSVMEEVNGGKRQAAGGIVVAHIERECVSIADG